VATKAQVQLKGIMKRFSDGIRSAVDAYVMKKVGQFSLNLVVKRTRLGYGVDQDGGNKSKLKFLSPRYIESRKQFKKLGLLSPTTTPKKSNLTRTGQMIDSLKFRIINRTTIQISPTGTRDDGEKNTDVAKWNADKGRVFLNISALEFKQITRFYRKNYGDLLRKRKLIK
jgi:hypothetical protein